jgi:hypothetical protein
MEIFQTNHLLETQFNEYLIIGDNEHIKSYKMAIKSLNKKYNGEDSFIFKTEEFEINLPSHISKYQTTFPEYIFEFHQHKFIFIIYKRDFDTSKLNFQTEIEKVFKSEFSETKIINQNYDDEKIFIEFIANNEELEIDEHNFITLYLNKEKNYYYSIRTISYTNNEDHFKKILKVHNSFNLLNL